MCYYYQPIFLSYFPEKMITLKNLWRKGLGSGEIYRYPERDERLVACDTLMSELDFHIRELERYKLDQEHEERRRKTGINN